MHASNNHAAQDTTIALLRKRFHIWHVRKEVRRICESCIVCRHASAQPLRQKMGVLPKKRVTLTLAFYDIDLDFIGPVHLKSYDSERMRKAYICAFTCMYSRAAHFELTNDITTE